MMHSPPCPEIFQAFEQAHAAFSADEVPVGCAIYHKSNGLIATAHNQVEKQKNPLAHAEMLGIQKACAVLGRKFLEGCTLYVTLEPCPMCAMAIAHARLARVVFSAYDPKSGGVIHGPRVFDTHVCHHKPEVIGGIREDLGRQLMQSFFQKRRDS